MSLISAFQGAVPKKVTSTIMQEFGRACGMLLHPVLDSITSYRFILLDLALLHSIKEVPADLPDFPMGLSQMHPFMADEVLKTDKVNHEFVT